MKYFVAYFHILPFALLPLLLLLVLVLLKARQKGTLGLAYFLFSWNSDSQPDEQESPLVVGFAAGFPHCCYLPAFLLTFKYKVMC